jgi:hypothetical protein
MTAYKSGIQEASTRTRKRVGWRAKSRMIAAAQYSAHRFCVAPLMDWNDNPEINVLEFRVQYVRSQRTKQE